jgi:hypothetical protein
MDDKSFWNSNLFKWLVLIAFCTPFVISYLKYFSKVQNLKRNNIYVNGVAGDWGGNGRIKYQKYSIFYNSKIYHGTYNSHDAKFGDTITVALDTISGFNIPVFILFNNKDSIKKYKHEFIF